MVMNTRHTKQRELEIGLVDMWQTLTPQGTRWTYYSEAPKICLQLRYFFIHCEIDALSHAPIILT